jgi:alkaline phosphatase
MQKPSSTDQSSCLEDSENFYPPQADTEPLLADNQDTKYSRHVQFNMPNDLESGTRAIRSNAYDGNLIIANSLPSISQSSFFSNMSSFSVLGLSVHYRKVDRLWALLLVILFTSFLLFSAFLVGLLSRTLLTLPHQDPPVRNIVLMISDGFGPASQTMARNYKQQVENLNVGFQLPLDTILVGSSRTRSSSSLVTDSAAGATAFSCAKKSYNGKT